MVGRTRNLNPNFGGIEINIPDNDVIKEMTYQELIELHGDIIETSNALQKKRNERYLALDTSVQKVISAGFPNVSRINVSERNYPEEDTLLSLYRNTMKLIKGLWTRTPWIEYFESLKIHDNIFIMMTKDHGSTPKYWLYNKSLIDDDRTSSAHGWPYSNYMRATSLHKKSLIPCVVSAINDGIMECTKLGGKKTFYMMREYNTDRFDRKIPLVVYSS